MKEERKTEKEGRFGGGRWRELRIWPIRTNTSRSACPRLARDWLSPTETTDDIELRLCASGEPVHGDVPIELIELYVQFNP